MPSGTASLLRLSLVPAEAAPGFTLTDQDGRVLSLSGFRGRAVVLEFMDSRCTGICPLVSWSSSTPTTTWAGRAAVWCSWRSTSTSGTTGWRMYSRTPRAHELSAIPGWYFFTGSGDALRAVWRNTASR